MYCSCDKFVFSFGFGQCNAEMDQMSTRRMDGKQCEKNGLIAQ